VNVFSVVHGHPYTGGIDLDIDKCRFPEGFTGVATLLRGPNMQAIEGAIGQLMVQESGLTWSYVLPASETARLPKTDNECSVQFLMSKGDQTFIIVDTLSLFVPR